MKRVIVDYAKLTNEILTLLVEKFPEGYDDSNIIRFKNAAGEYVQAVELRTEDTLYLVKISKSLSLFISNFDEAIETNNYQSQHPLLHGFNHSNSHESISISDEEGEEEVVIMEHKSKKNLL